MKRYGNLYPQIVDFQNLFLSYCSARKNKRYRTDVLQFTYRLEPNLIELQDELTRKTYRVGRYRKFYIYEPKQRLIMALPFRDRVVQWAIYRILNPILDRRYISDSYACRVGGGTHRAAARLQSWLQREHGHRMYVLKLDIAKYFYRVDHKVMLRIFEGIVKDPELLWLLDLIIDSKDTQFGIHLAGEIEDNDFLWSIGMPIGNLTSQMAANLYLDQVDQFVKHTLRARYYMRFADDSVTLHCDNSQLREWRKEINLFLRDELRLSLNSKTSIRSTLQGIDFCGFRIWDTHIKMRKRTALHMRRALRYLVQLYVDGEISFDTVNSSLNSYLGLLEHCDSYNLRKTLVTALSKIRSRRDRNEVS